MYLIFGREKTMQNLYTNKTIAIGLEPEFVNASPNQMNSFNQGSNLIDGLSYKSDPSVVTRWKSKRKMFNSYSSFNNAN
jgi:hypothetical protein